MKYVKFTDLQMYVWIHRRKCKLYGRICTIRKFTDERVKYTEEYVQFTEEGMTFTDLIAHSKIKVYLAFKYMLSSVTFTTNTRHNIISFVECFIPQKMFYIVSKNYKCLPIVFACNSKLTYISLPSIFPDFDVWKCKEWNVENECHQKSHNFSLRFIKRETAHRLPSRFVL